MKKRKIALCGVAVLAGLSLASCNKNNGGNNNNNGNNERPDTGFVSRVGDDWQANPNRPTVTSSDRLDIFINYKKTSGITARKAFNNPIENKNYNVGDLLPTWSALQDVVGTTLNKTVNFKDATTYGADKDDTSYKQLKATGYKSEVDNSQNVDLFYNTTANINAMGAAGEAVNLLDYIDYLPNFRKYLQDNPEVEQEITYGSGASAGIYSTPYFDGYNTVERLLIMDTEVVAKLLDNDVAAGFGEIMSGNGGNEKTVKGGSDASKYYQPFINATYNYTGKTTKVKVLKGDAVKEIEIAQTANIIKAQNEKLAQGVNGKTLLEDFKSYLRTAFAKPLSDGTYSKLSEIFTSESAAYNTDELVALMRVMKANPDILFGSTTEWKEVEGLFPRGQDNSRINNIAQFAGVLFGVQGLGAEAGHLYYTADGKLNDGETTKASYDCLDKLSDMYDEGLLLDNFYDEGTKAGKVYVNKYFAKTDSESSYGLLMYDYAATQSAPNDYKDGLGTKPESRKGVFQGTSVQGIKPIIAPLTYWATEEGWDHTAALGSDLDRSKKTLTRYYEENRCVKNTSWCIPTSTDNLEGALALMDAMFTEQGSKIQNYGPDAYTETGTVLGVANQVKFKQSVLQWYSSVGGDIWDFYRQYIGSTEGIGHVRPTALDFLSTNYYSQEGYTAVNTAIEKGVVVGSKTSVKLPTWSTSVRTACYPTISPTVSDAYKSITSFWANDKRKSSADGWVSVVVNGGTSYAGNVGNNGSADYTLASVYNLFTVKDSTYLYNYAESVGSWAIPDYTDPQQSK